MKKVLIIEDDQITRNSHTRTMEQSGYSVVSAANGPDGIAAALHEKPNLVVLDLGLPSPKPDSVEFNGFSVMRWLKGSTATRGIPVVVATAWPAEEARSKCVALGAEAFLQKPIKPQDLKTTAKILMDDY